MKSLIFVLLLFNFVIITCRNLRSLILTRDPEKYKILIEAANKTIYQIYAKKIDFLERNEVIIENSENMLLKVIVDDDPIFPKAENLILLI